MKARQPDVYIKEANAAGRKGKENLPHHFYYTTFIFFRSLSHSARHAARVRVFSIFCFNPTHYDNATRKRQALRVVLVCSLRYRAAVHKGDLIEAFGIE